MALLACRSSCRPPQESPSQRVYQTGQAKLPSLIPCHSSSFGAAPETAQRVGCSISQNYRAVRVAGPWRAKSDAVATCTGVQYVGRTTKKQGAGQKSKDGVRACCKRRHACGDKLSAVVMAHDGCRAGPKSKTVIALPERFALIWSINSWGASDVC